MEYYCKLEKEGASYVASFPDLPNVQTIGETREETLFNAADALSKQVGHRRPRASWTPWSRLPLMKSGENLPRQLFHSFQGSLSSVNSTMQRPIRFTVTSLVLNANSLGIGCLAFQDDTARRHVPACVSQIQLVGQRSSASGAPCSRHNPRAVAKSQSWRVSHCRSNGSAML